jgi:hypothetical protein
MVRQAGQDSQGVRARGPGQAQVQEHQGVGVEGPRAGTRVGKGRNVRMPGQTGARERESAGQRVEQEGQG